jgi:hypothetical protein
MANQETAVHRLSSTVEAQIFDLKLHYRAELRALEGPLSDGLDDEEEGW